MTARKRKAYKLDQYRQQWSEGRIAKNKETDLSGMKKIYSGHQPSDTDIDDITWKDLAMDSVYSEMNNCVTAVGDYSLYELLRKPLTDEAELKKRDSIISFIHDNETVRNEKKYALDRIGNNYVFLVEDNRGEMEEVQISKAEMVIGIVLFLISIAVIFVNAPAGLAALTVTAIANIVLHTKIRNRIDAFVPIINQISAMVSYSSEIAEKTGDDSLDELLGRIGFSDGIVRKYRKISQMINVQMGGFNELDYAVEYIRCFFYIDIWAFFKFRRAFCKDYKALSECIEAVGQLDAFISAAEYRNRLEKKGAALCSPVFDIKGVRVRAAYNPLIEACVENDYSFDNNILITGSNATGKSTFLRTVAVNCILAQTFYMACAGEYHSEFFRVMTSMNINDNILSGDSAFMAEIKSVKRILDVKNSPIRVLCCIDEILKGTNTVERISASAEILKELTQGNFLSIVSSHDLELTKPVSGLYNFYYFTEHIDADGLHNDFKVRTGISEERNAIKLLGLLGFSDEIVNRAEKRADRFISVGEWN